MNSESKNYSLSIKYGIRTLLVTCAIVLAMNVACANGSGVILLNWFGYVALEDIEKREYIVTGVDFMQTSIKIVIGVGLALFVYFVYRAIAQYKKTPLVKSPGRYFLL